MQPECSETLERRLALSSLVGVPAWKFLGPTNLRDGAMNLASSQIPVGQKRTTGAVEAFAIAPDGRLAYAGSVSGGLWVTDNFGDDHPSWTTTTDLLPSLSVSSIALSPLDPSGRTAFVGTGNTSNTNLYFNQANIGIIRTNDGGQTWTAPGLDTSRPGADVLSGLTVNAVVPTRLGDSPADEVVLAATSEGIYRSTDGGTTFADTTTTVAQGTPLPVIIYDLASDPSDTSRYIAIADTGVLVSRDGGVTWDGQGENAGLPEFGTVTNAEVRTVAHGATTTAYVLLQGNEAIGPANYHNVILGVFRAELGAGAPAWSNFGRAPAFRGKTSPDDLGSTYNLGLAVQPGPNGDLAYVTTFASTTNTYLYRLSASSPPVSLLANDSLYDGRSLTVTRLGGVTRLIETTDSGIYALASPRTARARTPWVSKIGNLAVTEVYAAAYDARHRLAAAAAQDVGNLAKTRTGRWKVVGAGDGIATAIDPSPHPTVYYFGYNIHGNRIRAGVDTPLRLASPATPRKPGSGLDPSERSQATQDFSVLAAVSDATPASPGPRPIVIAGYGLYESVPGTRPGNVVRTVVPPIPGESTNDGYGPYVAVAYGGHRNNAPDPGILYASLLDGEFLVRETPRGVPVDRPLPTGEPAAAIALDSRDSHQVLAATDSSLFESTDAGLHWREVVVPDPGQLSHLASLAVVDLTPSAPTSDMVVVLGGYGGAYRVRLGQGTVDPGDGRLNVSWARVGGVADAGPVTGNLGVRGNLPTAQVRTLQYDPRANLLVAGTLGRGLWELPRARASLA